MDRYEEALERAKAGKPIDEVFPELKESEDERIRKAIMGLTYIDGIEPILIKCSITAQDIRKYLEKLKEQKPVISDEAIREGVAHFGITQYQINNWLKKHINVIEQKPQNQCVDVIKMSALLAANRPASAEMTGRLKERKEILGNPEKYGLCKPAEWSEEDERMRNQLIYDVEYHKKEGLISAKQNKATKTLYNEIEKCYDEKIAWLKSLRPQPSQEWSKEDMMYLSQAIEVLEHENYLILADKLKSLRPSWKPSEEQMAALAAAKIGVDTDYELLESLYEQLKALM